MLLPKQKNNLIPNGWDSFEPYGNEGEETKAPLEVFEENYAQNELLNGDFRNGTNGWIGDNAVLQSLNGVLKITGTGAAHSAQARQPLRFEINNKYYVKAQMKVNNNLCTQFMVRISNTIVKNFLTPIENHWYHVDEVVTGSDEAFLGVRHYYQDALVADGKVAEVKNVLVINLSKVFGVGNEPTKEWCDENLKYYANWNDIPENDKPVRAWDNMAVHYTPLGNGLTRIQIWGGNSDTKLRFEKPFDNEDLTFSTYLENVGEEPLGIKSFDNKTEYYEPDFKGMVEQYGKG